MDKPPHLIRLVALTGFFIGLLGFFSTFTLAAQGKPGWALATFLAGLVLALGGLRLLSREPT